MKKFIQIKLKMQARAILKKYKPEIIGITGSVGKTSTREAIYTVLKSKYNVRQNIKNYNNEIGLPLTIIGVESPGKSIFGWIGVFLKALKLWLIRDKNYPEILVLEMGIDHPGDMDYLNSIVKCNIGVVTLIGPVHLEYFGSIGKIQKEKGRLIESLPKEGWSVLNYDNEKAREIKEKSKARVITFGLDEKADVRAQEIDLSNLGYAHKLNGIHFKMSYKGSAVPVTLPNVIGYNSIYSALAGAAIGVIKEMNLVEVAEALKDYNSPKGRMNIIKGIKHTLIIDDSYNSSPQAVVSALDIMKRVNIKNENRKFAVLGDMLELGSYSEEGHRMVGKHLVKSGINKLIVVGERSTDIAKGAIDAGMKKDDIFNFDKSEDAGRFVQDRIREGDLVLVKGSQGVRMEKIVKEIMADPLNAKSLLVRQDAQWIG